MKHFGDITKLSGYELPPVDVITGGSPCQDLSTAGNRAGLDGERSGLFLEQIRIVKELRNADKQRGRSEVFIRPRYMVWENVCGAFSSNGGCDFQRVLTECVRIAEPDAPDVPLPEKGKWGKSGILVGDGWSLAWRVLDAQYWGVPQRRRRIALVCDFGGQSAGEILFVPESVSGHFKTGGTEGQGFAGAVKTCAYPTVAIARGFPLYFRPENTRVYDESATTLCGARPGFTCGVIQNVRTQRGDILCMPIHDKATRYQGGGDTRKNDGSGNGLGVGKDGDSCPTLTAADRHAVFAASFVRRLTPLECERLQNFPDGWTDIGDWADDKGKVHKTSDAARYKALGNSIALPPWKWVLKRISARYERDATLGSLFDGISGFPLIWERMNGKGSAIWSSEIEPFCVAVAKRRFPED